MIAPFKPAAECDDRDVIHLKGFAARLDFEDAATARQADALIEAVAAHKRSRPSLCVAWDGDAPSDESFTRLLRRCASLGCGLIAFCYAADEAAFRKAWGPEGLAIRGYVVDEPPDDVACRWAFLGVSALRATRATECRWLGGGPVALREFEAKRESMRGRPRCRAYALRGLPETDEARLAAAAAEVASPVFGGRLIAVAMPTETDPVPLWRATADAANVRIAGVLSLRNHTAPFRHKSGLKGPKPDALQAAIRENGWEVGHVPAPYQPWQPMTRQTYAKCLAFVERCRRAAPPEAAEAAEEGEAAAAIKPPAVVVCCTRDMYLSGAFAVRYAIEELGYELADATQEFEEATPWPLC